MERMEWICRKGGEEKLEGDEEVEDVEEAGKDKVNGSYLPRGEGAWEIDSRMTDSNQHTTHLCLRLLAQSRVSLKFSLHPVLIPESRTTSQPTRQKPTAKRQYVYWWASWSHQQRPSLRLIQR